MSKKAREITLQDAAVATDNGSWQPVADLNRMSVHIKGITTATVQIYGSCDPTQPSDATDEIQVALDVTSDDILEITAKLKWIKAKISSWTAGTIYVYLLGDSTKYGI